MLWLRLYTGILNDRQLQTMPSELFRFTVNLWCYAKELDDNGTLPPIEDISFRLRMPEELVEKNMATLMEMDPPLVNVVDGVLTPRGWDKWQYPSDNATPRMRKHREGKKQTVTVTAPIVTSTVTVTANDRNNDRNGYGVEKSREEKSREEQITHTPSAVPASVTERAPIVRWCHWRTVEQGEWFERWWAEVWAKIGRGQAEKAFKAQVNTLDTFEAVLAATKAQAPMFKAKEPQFRPHPATWLNGKRWMDDEQVSLPKPRFAPSRFHVGMLEEPKA